MKNCLSILLAALLLLGLTACASKPPVQAEAPAQDNALTQNESLTHEIPLAEVGGSEEIELIEKNEEPSEAVAVEDATASEEKAVLTVAPLPVVFDPANTGDCTYPLTLDQKTGVTETDGVMTVQAELFCVEQYDTVDVHQMQAGDTFVCKSEDHTVISKEENEQGILITVDPMGPEGPTIQLVSADGGTYHIRGFDDYPTFRSLGVVTLTVAEDFTLENSSDLSAGTVTLTGADARSALSDPNLLIRKNNTRAHIVDNVLHSLTVTYMP